MQYVTTTGCKSTKLYREMKGFLYFFNYEFLTKLRRLKVPVITFQVFFCGERGIRTLGPLMRSTVFETAPFDHSGISPVIISFLKNKSDFFSRFISAEKEGFEPPVHCCTTVFKTAAIDHSAISPLQRYIFFVSRKYFLKKIFFS